MSASGNDLSVHMLAGNRTPGFIAYPKAPKTFRRFGGQSLSFGDWGRVLS